MKKRDEPVLNDLHRVLKYEVQFSGTFALSMVVPGCPNPGLDVDGAGRVPLPLTDQTAKLIASVGDQAPCGRGMETILDTTVRDTIQVDASNVRFMNPKWAPAIQEWVEQKVWSGLGCAPFTSPPKCELYKLLLYKPGAHFLPHQDTEKASGMFATLIVVLPSEFTGGEIHVSHGGESKIFDNAKDSAFETTILAWYTDVTHEVKEITSCYRLALSYHLINTSSGISAPHLPSGDSSLQSLREIFHKWSRDEYPSSGGGQIAVYAFTHLYSDTSLREVILKGKDQHIASILRQAADQEGILVLMGWLNARIEGYTADNGWQTYEGYDGDYPEYGVDAGTYDDPVMSQVGETEIWVEGLQDMQGREIEITQISFEADSILPFRAFSGVYPNESKLSEGCWGNEGAPLEFMYKCAALAMFPKKYQLLLMLSSEMGVDWGLEELEKSKPEGPSKENREILEFLARQNNKALMATALKFAFEWNDVVAWGRIVEQDTKFFLQERGFTSLCDGWEAFKFDGVRPTFEMLFQERDWLQKESIDFLLFVKERLPFGTDPQKDEWISAQATRAMETVSLAESYRLDPNMLEIVNWRGLEFASSVILPRFPDKHMAFYPMVDLGIGLIERKERLIALPRAGGQTSNAELFDHILDEILGATIPKLLPLDRSDPARGVSSLLSICIGGNKTKAYERVLNIICHPPKEPFYTQYLNLYAKVIPDLVKLLGEHGISVSSSPSREFFCYIIGTYLGEVLGSKEGSPYLKFSILTCGHEGCERVNDFLRSEERERSILIEEAAKRCFPSLKIDERYPLFEWSSHRYDSPLCMLIKSDEAMAGQHWRARLDDAKKLLETIGTGEEIARIMGERYQDVVRALEGSKAFWITEIETKERADLK